MQYVGVISMRRGRVIFLYPQVLRARCSAYAEMNLCLGTPQETASYLNSTSTQCQGSNSSGVGDSSVRNDGYRESGGGQRLQAFF